MVEFGGDTGGGERAYDSFQIFPARYGFSAGGKRSEHLAGDVFFDMQQIRGSQP